MGTPSILVAFGLLAPVSLGSGADLQDAPRAVEWGRAPDDEKGFGPERTMRDIERLLRSSASEDRGHVAGLYRLEQDIRVLLAMATDRYEELGYFGLLDVAKREEELQTRAGEEWLTPLERLDAAFRERAARAVPELLEAGPTAELFAKLLVDSRFRTRALVIEGLEFEMRDLRSGMAVLQAHLDGFANLRDQEGDSIARRVDLAAARLRAAKLDLEALREERTDATAGEAWGKDLEILLALARSKDPARIDAELPPVLERLDQREASMAAALFTTRLDTKIAGEIDRRALAITTAADLLTKIRPYFPGTPESEAADAEIKALSRSRRYAYASRAVVEALNYDPLNEELNWFGGESSDFLWGSMESRRWFDRFLALRGIRVHDYRTFKDRSLTREEKRAIDAVQAVAGAPVPAQPK
ncbi:MAG: hypothetical protein ACKVXR_00780 [Planctomycetota bacterium]